MKKILLFLFIIAANIVHAQQKNMQDWANLKKYETDDENLKPASSKEKRIVFMGNSITEYWKV